jgi:hypothetical protein
MCLGTTTIGSERHQVIDYDCRGTALHLRHHHTELSTDITEVQMFLVTNLEQMDTRYGVS